MSGAHNRHRRVEHVVDADIADTAAVARFSAKPRVAATQIQIAAEAAVKEPMTVAVWREAAR